eukprot:SAG11_NODE_1825_length_4203_cov_3.238304_1_plen_74_part_10
MTDPLCAAMRLTHHVEDLSPTRIAAEPKPAEDELEKYVRRCVQRMAGAEGYEGMLFFNDEPYCAWSDVIGHMES